MDCGEWQVHVQRGVLQSLRLAVPADVLVGTVLDQVLLIQNINVC